MDDSSINGSDDTPRAKRVKTNPKDTSPSSILDKIGNDDNGDVFCTRCREWFCLLCEGYGHDKENNVFYCSPCNTETFYASCCKQDKPMSERFFTCRMCENENCKVCWPDKDKWPNCAKCREFFCLSCARFGGQDKNGTFYCCPCFSRMDNDNDKNSNDSEGSKTFLAACCGKNRPISKLLFTCGTCGKDNCKVCWPDSSL